MVRDATMLLLALGATLLLAGGGRCLARRVFRLLPRRARRALPAEGKAVLITGCDKGFGHALAKWLHSKGFTVFAGCLLADENGDGARELKNMKSDRMKVLQMNVCSDQEVSQAVDFVKRTLKEPEEGLWGLVNNAGISTFGEVEFASLDNYKKVAETNLWGTVRVTKAFLPLIRRAKGRVVNITSMLGRMASPSRSCYCISKFGVAAFSDCLRQEMYRWGVRVILIEPSNFVAATGILTADSIDKQAEALWSGASDTVQEDYGSEYFTCQVAQMKSFVNSGLKDMSLVLNDITDALISPCPNNRYNPMETYWWVRLQVMTHLPTAIADWLYIPGATLKLCMNACPGTYPGSPPEKKMEIKCLNTSKVHFDNGKVPAWGLGKGFEVAMSVFEEN